MSSAGVVTLSFSVFIPPHSIIFLKLQNAGLTNQAFPQDKSSVSKGLSSIEKESKL
jgi:hypothetical protein